MPRMYAVYAVIVAALLAGIAASVPWHSQPAPVIVAEPARPAPPLPKAKPAVRVKAVGKAAKIDCSQVQWAKRNLSADTLTSLAASHPAQAQAAKACP